MIYLYRSLLIIVWLTGCTQIGRLTFVADINRSLNEVSAIEQDVISDTFWVIEDSGNKNKLYQLNSSGAIIKSITIANAKNKDWEDLTIDEQGHIYIGDIGNNNGKRSTFQIYKVFNKDLENASAIADIIEFTFPKHLKPKDMEGFLLFENHFYIFTKESKDFSVLKVPNIPGKHEAIVVSIFRFKAKNTKITSAAISPDNTSIVLLNHDKLWLLKDFKGDDFFSGDIIEKDFKHSSQKEGIGFKSNTEVLITDERNGGEGGNIYSYTLNKH